MWDVAIKKAIEATKNAHTQISGVKVGAAVIAFNKEKNLCDIFSGCNIELASSRGFHAESVALSKAISEGFPVIGGCVVTGSDDNHMAAMCGYCMQDFLYANPDCEVLVARMDGSIKLKVSLRERNGEYGYYGKGRLQI